MIYLPLDIPRAKILITVKTYPLPYTSHGEVVCTAGIMEDGKWIRIYPILYRDLPEEKRFKKYHWIELDLVKKKQDFRPETYRPRKDIVSNLSIIDTVTTDKDKYWSSRKNIVLKEVFTSFSDLLKLAKPPIFKSLAIIKPFKIINFSAEKCAPDWDSSWKEKWKQLGIFDEIGSNRSAKYVNKVPYTFYYHFFTDGDKKPRKLMIEDWEIGALYWKCLKTANNDEQKALKLVRQKYYDELVLTKDLYFFVGTSYTKHVYQARNPFIIIGLFYPPKTRPKTQVELFS